MTQDQMLFVGGYICGFLTFPVLVSIVCAVLIWRYSEDEYPHY